jgi:hypothetical protein
MKIFFKLAAILLALLLLTACGDGTYTLYRSSPTLGGGIARIHVATFDADEGQRYNMENCEIAMELFKSQQGLTVKYWCEKGKYKK